MGERNSGGEVYRVCCRKQNADTKYILKKETRIVLLEQHHCDKNKMITHLVRQIWDLIRKYYQSSAIYTIGPAPTANL